MKTTKMGLIRFLFIVCLGFIGLMSFVDFMANERDLDLMDRQRPIVIEFEMVEV